MSAVAHQVVQVSTILVDEELRLDARYWQEGFRAARSRVFDSGLGVRTLGGEAGLARVWFPSRFKRVYALSAEHGTPFLRAHATFYTIPESDRILSRSQTRGFETYLVERGVLLLACSGTLGAVTFVTDHLAQFAITHDLIRIVPESEERGLYLLAFLQTSDGQMLATHDEHGSAVPHISDKQAARIPVPMLDGATSARIVGLMQESTERREEHTRTLKRLHREFLAECGLPEVEDFHPEHLHGSLRGWALPSRALSFKRLDAEHFSPAHRLARALIDDTRAGLALSELADVRMLNRYRRIYVEPGYGTPILGGRHIHQWRPIGLKHIADRSFVNPDAYTLRAGMTVFPADGRATEKLGEPAYVTSLWDGWKGSNHLMRLIPRDGVGEGLLYLAVASPYVQIQLRSSATGSVVDALTPEVIAGIQIPLPDGSRAEELDAQCVSALEGLAQARRTEDRAIEAFGQALAGSSG